MGANTGQIDAILSDDSKILCLAGAGTGKTHTLIERISRLVALDIDPTSILCVTFTNAAAFEMKRRFQKKNPGVNPPEFRTFHSFCYDVLLNSAPIKRKLGFTGTPSIADEAAEKRILKQAALQIGVQLSQDKISGKKMMTMSEQKSYQLLKKAAERLMKQENLITFDSLSTNISNLFIENDELVAKYKDRFKYIFVDEFQDTDPTEWKFIQSFKDAQLFVVGDVLQALYSFRGADSSIIKAVADDPEWTTIKLELNYRSTKQICKYANDFTKTYASPNYRLEIQSDKHGGPVIEHIISEYHKHTPEHVYEDIMETLSNSHGSSAILARTNAEVTEMQDWLKEHNIVFNTGRSDEDILHVLKAAVDDEYLIDWLATYLTSERYADYIKQRTIATTIDGEYTVDNFIEQYGWTFAIKTKLELIYNIKRTCNALEVMEDRLHAVLKLIKHTDLSIDCSKYNSTEDLLRAVADAVELHKDETDLYVGTVHSVKGLEYDNVFVIGVDGPSFRLSTEDNNNIFYVAITRARQNLVVYQMEY